MQYNRSHWEQAPVRYATTPLRVLPEIVLLVIVTLPSSLYSPPPSLAVLPEMVLLLIVTLPAQVIYATALIGGIARDVLFVIVTVPT